MQVMANLCGDLSSVCLIFLNYFLFFLQRQWVTMVVPSLMVTRVAYTSQEPTLHVTTSCHRQDSLRDQASHRLMHQSHNRMLRWQPHRCTARLQPTRHYRQHFRRQLQHRLPKWHRHRQIHRHIPECPTHPSPQSRLPQAIHRPSMLLRHTLAHRPHLGPLIQDIHHRHPWRWQGPWSTRPVLTVPQYQVFLPGVIHQWGIPQVNSLVLLPHILWPPHTDPHTSNS